MTWALCRWICLERDCWSLMIWWEASHSSASQHLLPNWASFHVLAISHKHILTWLQLHSLLAQAHGSEQKSLMYVLHSRIRTIGYSAETQANIAGHLPFCSKCKGTSINDVTFWPLSRPCHHFSGWLILSFCCYLDVVVLLLTQCCSVLRLSSLKLLLCTNVLNDVTAAHFSVSFS